MNTKAIVVMGVSGVGKSTLGAALAQRLGGVFVDADDHHPETNRAKMTRGEALSDHDRWPWLEELHTVLATHVHGNTPVVLACSALKETYRNVLIGTLESVCVVYLHGERDLIAQRMRQRQHFMPVELLDSQWQTLEPPKDALWLTVDAPLEVLVSSVLQTLYDAQHERRNH